MAVPTFPQKSGFEGNFAFESVTGEAAMPTTAHWRITCDHTGQTVQDWTAGTLTTETSGGAVTRVSVTVEVPGTVNVLCDTGNARESHTLTVVADKDTDREYSEDFGYYVKRGGR
jgi:hypothetical protein